MIRTPYIKERHNTPHENVTRSVSLTYIAGWWVSLLMVRLFQMQVLCVRRSKMKLTEWRGEQSKFPQFQFIWAFILQMVWTFLCIYILSYLFPLDRWKFRDAWIWPFKLCQQYFIDSIGFSIRYDVIFFGVEVWVKEILSWCIWTMEIFNVC